MQGFSGTSPQHLHSSEINVEPSLQQLISQQGDTKLWWGPEHTGYDTDGKK